MTTDLTTFHDYADGPALAKSCATMSGILAPKGDKGVFLDPIPGDPGSAPRDGAPVMCTEFGGVNIASASSESDGGSREDDWGYTTATDAADLLKRVERLLMGVVEGGHICGFVYTQL